MKESESLLWNWEFYTNQILRRLSMKTVRPDRAQILRRAIAPVISDFIKSSEAAAADFHAVENAAAIAINHLRKLLISAGLTAAVAETPSFHCPNCSQPLGAWKQKPRTIVTAEGEGSYPAVRYRCSEVTMSREPACLLRMARDGYGNVCVCTFLRLLRCWISTMLASM